MSAPFTRDELAHLGKRSTRFVLPTELAFVSETKRVFSGRGRRRYGGLKWEGVGGQIRIEGLGEQRGTQARTVTVSLSGATQDMAKTAFAETDEAFGRPISIYLQLLDGDEQPFGSLKLIFAGTMQRPQVTRTPMTRDGGGSFTVTIPCESVMLPRAFVPHGRYTDRDQQIESPGDRIFERMYEIRDLVVSFPNPD